MLASTRHGGKFEISFWKWCIFIDEKHVFLCNLSDATSFEMANGCLERDLTDRVLLYVGLYRVVACVQNVIRICSLDGSIYEAGVRPRGWRWVVMTTAATNHPEVTRSEITPHPIRFKGTRGATRFAPFDTTVLTPRAPKFYKLT